MPNERGQMEMLGLAIIMVIVLLGIMFALRFFFFAPQDNPTQDARDVQLGANLLDTMMETTMTCRGVPLVTLLQDCANGGPISCDDITITDAGGTTVKVIEGGTNCEHAQNVLNYFFSKTLDSWQRKYEFSVEGPGPVANIAANNGHCDSGSQLITRPRPIGGGQTMTINLRLCK